MMSLLNSDTIRLIKGVVEDGREARSTHSIVGDFVESTTNIQKIDEVQFTFP